MLLGHETAVTALAGTGKKRALTRETTPENGLKLPGHRTGGLGGFLCNKLRKKYSIDGLHEVY